ncbi:hypothetical protein CAEBREN_05028 [Caenorhabditis brenneri]|uniref:Uncharacterized protein n=1 Tax=Caenorhabditis brenneri TaxID=135651 RepID=G0ND40_CAEBE|nr:hypothetical protein CAEBREN_05028 [Caenorhabditis brenneri]
MVEIDQTRVKYITKPFPNEEVLDETFKRIQAVFHIVGHFGLIATMIIRGLSLSNGISGLNCAKGFALDDDTERARNLNF